MSKFNYLGILKYEDMKNIKDDIYFEFEVEAHNEDLINNYLEHVRGLNNTDFKRFLCDLLEVPYPTDTKVIEDMIKEKLH